MTASSTHPVLSLRAVAVSQVSNRPDSSGADASMSMSDPSVWKKNYSSQNELYKGVVASEIGQCKT